MSRETRALVCLLAAGSILFGIMLYTGALMVDTWEINRSTAQLRHDAAVMELREAEREARP